MFRCEIFVCAKREQNRTHKFCYETISRDFKRYELIKVKNNYTIAEVRNKRFQKKFVGIFYVRGTPIPIEITIIICTGTL